ncbi:conserved hypothetical protein [Leptospira interrogans serovar Copenhageni str. Fiocruz L1-130]|uniref:Uncharacterized protein n=1 Tax=Leptospira interrogans serogroup Icterohaemorrhagiae serovar copenhageni (strain Fiocruz L1-130) TaxID=267671 RepID=Q72TI8_LEPIC|nr:conserved hypothetical protein [Leptospira interrogans serovar Copenhageni str. Fiocruz L1-130]
MLSSSTRFIESRCVEFSLFLGGGGGGKVFFIRKTYFLQVKRLILVGTLQKCTFLILLILKSY